MSDPADTLERFVDHLTRGFTPELAKHFAELPKPDPEFQARLDALAAKANEGALTPDESQEYEKYVRGVYGLRRVHASKGSIAR